jgi:Tfp pilus assembly protein PilF
MEDIDELYEKAYFLVTCQTKEKMAESIKIYIEILNIDPNHRKANHDLTMAYISIYEYELAYIQGCNYMKKYPNDYRAYNVLGLIEYRNGNLKEAKDYFNKTIELKNGFSGAYNNLGIIELKQNNYDRAKSYLKKSLSFEKTYTSLFVLAICNMLTEDYDIARNYYDSLDKQEKFKKYELYKEVNKQMILHKHNQEYIGQCRKIINNLLKVI